MGSVSLSDQHKPIHLLTNHSGKLNACNLVVLATFENMIKQQDILESINPRLKSFFRGKKTMVKARIKALEVGYTQTFREYNFQC